jgi:hypothetical protein
MQSVRTALNRSTRGFSVRHPFPFPPSPSLSLTDTHFTHPDAQPAQTSATRAYAQQQAQTSSYVPNKNPDGARQPPPWCSDDESS